MTRVPSGLTHSDGPTVPLNPERPARVLAMIRAVDLNSRTNLMPVADSGIVESEARSGCCFRCLSQSGPGFQPKAPGQVMWWKHCNGATLHCVNPTISSEGQGREGLQ
jgi:hypothetical protein